MSAERKIHPHDDVASSDDVSVTVESIIDNGDQTCSVKGKILVSGQPSPEKIIRVFNEAIARHLGTETIKGPAMVNSSEYRDGWDRIFKKSDGVLN